jgi:hypothetical protein
MRTNNLMCVVIAALVAACGPNSSESSSTVKGRTGDELGVQQQGLGSAALGGQGSAAAASKVRVSKLGANGALETVGEGSVNAGGTFEVAISAAGAKRLIVQALDSAGEVRESVILEQAAGAGATAVVAPMSTETSVEAEVLLQLVAQGIDVAECNAIDLRARIDAQLAAAVSQSSDKAARIKSLAEAIAAAQRAQLEAYAEAGVNTTQSALFEAQLSAAASLNTALDAAANDRSRAEQAYAEFLTALEARTQTVAGDAKKAARGERAASVAFRATISGRATAEAALIDAAVRQAAALEARAASEAIEATLRAGGASQDTLDSVVTAGHSLRASLAASTSATATATAWAAYRAKVLGTASASTSVLGTYLEVNVTNETSLQAALTACADAATQLDASLDVASRSVSEASGTIDVRTVSSNIVNALKTFDAAVETQASGLAAFTGKADVAVEVMVQANGSLRLVR